MKRPCTALDHGTQCSNTVETRKPYSVPVYCEEHRRGRDRSKFGPRDRLQVYVPYKLMSWLNREAQRLGKPRDELVLELLDRSIQDHVRRNSNAVELPLPTNEQPWWWGKDEER